MGQITAIEPQQKNPERVNIYLDGTFSFGLARITAGWLKVGQELSTEKTAELQVEDDRETAFQKALHFLSFRPRSAAEVRKNLVKHDLSEAVIDETMKRLQGAGLVNDLEFARVWVENRNTFHPRSKAALRMELHRKGLTEEILQPLLDEFVNEDNLAFDAARRYARRLTGLGRLEFRQKLNGYLMRRGFSFSTISPVVSEVWKETRMADEGETLVDKD